MIQQSAVFSCGRARNEGDELYFETRGSGPALLLIPGGGGDGDTFRRVAEILADEYRVITYDRRANGRSTLREPQNFEISQQSRDAAAVLEACGESSAWIVGNSSGAVIALDIAKTQARIARAVVAHEPPLARLHPQAKKWQRFYASVYATAFQFGSGLAALRFLLGTGLPVREMIQAGRENRAGQLADGQSRIDARSASDVMMKLELLPVVNYLPDAPALRAGRARVFPAAGRESLEKKRWYAQTAQILAEQLRVDLTVLPGHHASFLNRPEEWAAGLRVALKRLA